VDQRLERVVDAGRVPDGVVERARVVQRLLDRPALGLVLDLVDARDDAGRRLGHERTAVALLLDEIAGDVPELGRKILVDEKDMHWD
jgi:hypothetical protein